MEREAPDPVTPRKKTNISPQKGKANNHTSQ